MNPIQALRKDCQKDARLRTKSSKDLRTGRSTALRNGWLPTADARYCRVSVPSPLIIALDDTYAALVSLGSAEQSKADYQAWFESIELLFRDFTPTVHDIFEDAAANKVVVWVTSDASTPIGPYHNEYMLALYFTEDQRKVETFLEYVDAAVSKDFLPRLNQWAAEHPDKKW
jgi:ketosteroid isomerase-like protein